jgi:hypothetical protein
MPKLNSNELQSPEAGKAKETTKKHSKEIQEEMNKIRFSKIQG